MKNNSIFTIALLILIINSISVYAPNGNDDDVVVEDYHKMDRKGQQKYLEEKLGIHGLNPDNVEVVGNTVTIKSGAGDLSELKGDINIDLNGGKVKLFNWDKGKSFSGDIKIGDQGGEIDTYNGFFRFGNTANVQVVKGKLTFKDADILDGTKLGILFEGDEDKRDIISGKGVSLIEKKIPREDYSRGYVTEKALKTKQKLILNGVTYIPESGSEIIYYLETLQKRAHEGKIKEFSRGGLFSSNNWVVIKDDTEIIGRFKGKVLKGYNKEKQSLTLFVEPEDEVEFINHKGTYIWLKGGSYDEPNEYTVGKHSEDDISYNGDLYVNLRGKEMDIRTRDGDYKDILVEPSGGFGRDFNLFIEKEKIDPDEITDKLLISFYEDKPIMKGSIKDLKTNIGTMIRDDSGFYLPWAIAEGEEIDFRNIVGNKESLLATKESLKDYLRLLKKSKSNEVITSITKNIVKYSGLVSDKDTLMAYDQFWQLSALAQASKHDPEFQDILLDNLDLPDERYLIPIFKEFNDDATMQKKLLENTNLLLTHSKARTILAYSADKEVFSQAVKKVYSEAFVSLGKEAKSWDKNSMENIYSQDSFWKKTKHLSPESRWSVALTSERYLQRQGKEPDLKNIDSSVDAILKLRNTFSEHRILDKDTTLIPITHEELVSKMIWFPKEEDKDNPKYYEYRFREDNMKKIAEDSGVPDYKIFSDLKGPKAKTRIRNAIESSSGKTTVWFNGHGGPNHIGLGKKLTAGSEMSDKMHRPDAISYVELGDSLLEREKRTNTLADVDLMLDACYTYDYAQNTYQYLEQRRVMGHLLKESSQLTIDEKEVVEKWNAEISKKGVIKSKEYNEFIDKLSNSKLKNNVDEYRENLGYPIIITATNRGQVGFSMSPDDVEGRETESQSEFYNGLINAKEKGKPLTGKDIFDSEKYYFHMEDAAVFLQTKEGIHDLGSNKDDFVNIKKNTLEDILRRIFMKNKKPPYSPFPDKVIEIGQIEPDMQEKLGKGVVEETAIV